MYEENPYLSFQDTPISFELIDVEDKISIVKTPILEELLSDKMTAFAPKTIGITYDSGKKIEIIKQLFDISTIYNRLGIDDHTIDMYYEIAKHELKCRKMIEETTPLDCINDSIEASELILSNGTHWNITDFSYLRTGVNGFKHYLNGSFNINDAFRLAADAYIMYVVTKSESIKNFDDLMLKSEDVNIDDTFLKGNKRFLSRHLENFNDLLKTIAVNNLLNENDN